MEILDFVASHIFPFLPARTQRGCCYFRGRERFRLYDTSRRPGEEAAEMDPPSLRADICCEKPWPGADVTDEARLKYESEVHKLVAGGKLPSVTLSGTSQWSDYRNSNPLAAVEAQKMKTARTVGEIPNTLVMSPAVFLKLQNHPKILDCFPNTAILGPSRLKNIFDVDNFLVASPPVWNKDALLCYVPPEPRMGTMALGYTFRRQSYYDVQFVEPEAGFYWINATA